MLLDNVGLTVGKNFLFLLNKVGNDKNLKESLTSKVSKTLGNIIIARLPRRPTGEFCHKHPRKQIYFWVTVFFIFYSL